MIGYSVSHWGIVLIPDDANRKNVQFNQNETIEPLEPGEPLLIQCKPAFPDSSRWIRPLRPIRIG